MKAFDACIGLVLVVAGCSLVIGAIQNNPIFILRSLVGSVGLLLVLMPIAAVLEKTK